MTLADWVCYENLNLLLAFAISVYLTGSFWIIRYLGDALDLPEEELDELISKRFFLCGIFQEFLGFMIVSLVFNLFWFWDMLIALTMNFVVELIMIIIYVIFFLPKNQSSEDIDDIDNIDNV